MFKVRFLPIPDASFYWKARASVTEAIDPTRPNHEKRKMSKLKIKKAWLFNYDNGKINKVKVKPCGALVIADDELADYCEDAEINSIYDRNVFLNKSMAKSYRYRYLLECIDTALDISVGYNLTLLLEAKSIFKRFRPYSLKNRHMDMPAFNHALKVLEQ